MAFHPLWFRHPCRSAAVGAALDRHHIVQLEIVAGEGRHISSSGSPKSLSHSTVIAQVTISVKAGTAKARIGTVQRITLPMNTGNCSSKEETSIQDGKRISIRIHETHVSGRKGEFLTRAVCVRCPSIMGPQRPGKKDLPSTLQAFLRGAYSGYNLRHPRPRQPEGNRSTSCICRIIQ